jgi:hypothetical protein
MKWQLRDPYEWRRAFALIPVLVGDALVWLEWYWVRQSPNSGDEPWNERSLSDPSRKEASPQ